jgi:hypothetical protein
MSRYLLIPGLAIVLFSCSTEPEVTDEIVLEGVEAEIAPEDTYDYDTLQGLYMGDFGGSDIRIMLNYVSKKNAIGYNIHKGLQRNLNGKVTRKDDEVTIVLSEPGDHEYDGKFTVMFNGENNNLSAKASWTSNSGKISPKEFTLNKVVRDKDIDYNEVSISSFASIFNYYSDTIGIYQFEDDGLVILEYYDDDQDEEDRDASQMIRLNGTWSLDGKEVTIQWQKNDIFPNNVLKLTADKGEWGEWALQGEGDHQLWMMYP